MALKYDDSLQEVHSKIGKLNTAANEQSTSVNNISASEARGDEEEQIVVFYR